MKEWNALRWNEKNEEMKEWEELGDSLFDSLHSFQQVCKCVKVYRVGIDVKQCAVAVNEFVGGLFHLDATFNLTHNHRGTSRQKKTRRR